MLNNSFWSEIKNIYPSKMPYLIERDPEDRQTAIISFPPFDLIFVVLNMYEFSFKCLGFIERNHLVSQTVKKGHNLALNSIS